MPAFDRRSGMAPESAGGRSGGPAPAASNRPAASRVGELDLLVGRPIGHQMHLLALAVAGAADLAAFYTVISTILPDFSIAVWCVVLGVSAMAVMLSHFAGTAFRDGYEGHLPAGRLLGSIALLAWLGLGLGATYVRWVAGRDESLSGIDPALAAPTSLMLLALYLATGTVATVGAYITHNRMLSVGFLGDSAQYRDPAAADTTLKALAKAITDNDYRVELIGTTATSGSEKGRLALSTQRAEAVRQSLQQHGVPAGSFASVRGVGTKWPSHVDDVGPDGTLLPGPAARNRSVVIRVDCR